MLLSKNNPVLIVGYPRSGTTLIRVLLDSHPDLSIGPELKFIKNFMVKFPDKFEDFVQFTQSAADDFGFDQKKLKELFDNHKSWDKVMVQWCSDYATGRGKKNWGEKTPQNYKYLSQLLEKFPDALYIYIVRNPYDVMGSMKLKGWYKRYNSPISWTIANHRAKLLKKYNFVFIKYEEFVLTPQKYLNEIQEKAGLTKYNLLDTYRDIYHGHIAQGDIWNQEIISSERTSKRSQLSRTDKLHIKFFCLPYLLKYKYK